MHLETTFVLMKNDVSYKKYIKMIIHYTRGVATNNGLGKPGLN